LDLTQVNGDNLKNVNMKLQASSEQKSVVVSGRHKASEVETNRKNRNIRDLNSVIN
jgi:hypothetical protein